MNGERLNHLRFADNIVIMTDNICDMIQMVHELDLESRKVGLKMNMSKTKVLLNNFVKKEESTVCTGNQLKMYTWVATKVCIRNENCFHETPQC